MSERRRDDFLLLGDMLDSARKIQRYTEGFDYESFIADDKTVDAVIRNFEIIGEAANRIDPDFRIEHSEIEWRRIRGFRNRLVHDYFGVDYQIVWSVVENDLNALVDRLGEIVED